MLRGLLTIPFQNSVGLEAGPSLFSSSLSLFGAGDVPAGPFFILRLEHHRPLAALAVRTSASGSIGSPRARAARSASVCTTSRSAWAARAHCAPVRAFRAVMALAQVAIMVLPATRHS